MVNILLFTDKKKEKKRIGVELCSRIVTSFLGLDFSRLFLPRCCHGVPSPCIHLIKLKLIKYFTVFFLSFIDSSDCDIGIGSKEIGNTEVFSFDLNDSDEGVISSGGVIDSSSSSIDNSP